jgi:DNA invertase Pin-like site-specific DNA recombinase
MEAMKYGYARVSTDDHTTALQTAALRKAGCKTIFNGDGLSAATTKRPALLRCLTKLDHGDTLIARKLDRSGRGLADLMRMLDDFKKRGVKFRSLTEVIDTETPTGHAMWQMISVPAELERSLTWRAQTRRREGREDRRREIRAQAETHTAAHRPRPENDPIRRAPRGRCCAFEG